jgi:pre-rRNA-processing protein TSR1
MFNGVDGAPRIVAVVPLCSDTSARDMAKSLVGGVDADMDTTNCPEFGVWRIRSVRIPFNTSYLNSFHFKGGTFSN